MATIKAKLVEVNREEWLAVLTKAKDKVAEEHKQKWADLRLGAERARGHRKVYLHAEDHELISKAANENVSGQAGKGLGNRADVQHG